MASYMIHACSLDPAFWVEAISCATHIPNRVPHKALQGITPFKAWAGRKSIVRHFRVFGCPAWARIPPHKRKSLEPKSHPCIFVGYPEGVKAYRLMDPETHEVFIERNVHFEESSPSLTSLPPPPSSIVDSDVSDSDDETPSTLTRRVTPLQGALEVEEPRSPPPPRLRLARQTLESMGSLVRDPSDTQRTRSQH